MQDADGTGGTHTDLQPSAGIQTTCRQPPQHLQLLGQTICASGIELTLHVAQKSRIDHSTFKVATASQHQGLVHRLAVAVVALLDVSVFVWAGRLRSTALQTVVVEKPFISLREIVGMVELLNGRRQTVRLMRPRHTAQFP